MTRIFLLLLSLSRSLWLLSFRLSLKTVFLLVTGVYYFIIAHCFAVIFWSFVLNLNLVFSIRHILTSRCHGQKNLNAMYTLFFYLVLLLVPKFVYPRTKYITAAAVVAAAAVACLHFIVVYMSFFLFLSMDFHFIAINILFSCFLWISQVDFYLPWPFVAVCTFVLLSFNANDADVRRDFFLLLWFNASCHALFYIISLCTTEWIHIVYNT